MSSSPPDTTPPDPPLDSPPDKPTQVKFYRPAQMALFAQIVTYPPLSQVTVIPPTHKEFNFTVTLESSKSLPERPWEVSIWYDHGAYLAQKLPWQALDLEPVEHSPYTLYDDSESQSYRYIFSGNLASPFTSTDKVYRGRRVPFTVRYRIDSSSEWMWVYHNFNIADGELILQPPIDPNFLGASPVDLKSGWTTRKLTSEAPDARLYGIDSAAPIPPSGDEDAITHTQVLGRVLQTSRWFALVRIWAPWIAPRHGEQKLHLSEPAILLSFLRLDGLHVILLAINGIDESVTTFASTPDGEIEVRTRNDSTQPRKFRILAATAWSFEAANCAVMYEARKLVRQSSAYLDAADKLPKEIEAESVDSDTVLITHNGCTAGSADDPTPAPQWLESWYDGLAYCTWNSLGQDLDADKIMSGLDALAAHKIHVSTLIIDDNWQSLSGKQGDEQTHRGWTDFEANPIGFPLGLKATVSAIRAKHPHIRDIAVWHALLGYWGAVSPQGWIADNYKTQPIDTQRGPRVAVSPDDIHRLYNDFYAFLSSAGITSVKTDAQFTLDELTSTRDRAAFPAAYLSAWTQAHLTHLAGRAISCMSQTPYIMTHLFLPTNTPRVLLRNSDDFFPDVPTSHPWHVFANAHNALFVQHLNVLPDWDMFQTKHAYSGFHAAARCVSGGPIYITDAPGEHDVELIGEMTARNCRGGTVILRPSGVGRTVGVYDRYEARGVLKVGVWDGRSECGTGILGVFNLGEEEQGVVLPVTKFPGVHVGDGEATRRKWVVRSHRTGRVTGAIEPKVPAEAQGLLHGRLEVRGYDIWSALPVREAEVDGKTIEVAVVGLLGKMTGACAIVETTLTVEKRLKVHVQLKALGRLGIWVGDAQTRKVADLMVLVQGKAVPEDKVGISTAGIHGHQAGVVEVDVEGAWDEMQLDPGWSNEVGVEVFIG